ncbi:hypothetical protein PG994_013556 [Apiospora phragmitis]|uniref:Uncharacterized protein n=1 Tax=Apiospora phragmitis TaxID=2905665 RepID=A0ABR1T932_9PEZI
MSQLNPNRRKADGVSPASSAESYDRYHTPPTSEASAKASSGPATAKLTRTWTNSPVAKRRTLHISTAESKKSPLPTSDITESSPAEQSRTPIIRANGPPSDTLFQVSRTQAPPLPHRLVQTLISPTRLPRLLPLPRLAHPRLPLAHAFARFTPPAGAPSRCRFWAPRVVSVLWPRALRDGNVENMIEFAQHRNAIPDCLGVVGGGGGGGEYLGSPGKRRWFACVDDEELGRLECCEACHEDRVVDTGFADRFEPALEQPPDETDSRKCILSIRHIQSSLETFARRDDWASFLVAARQRLRASDCQGRVVTASSTDWFTRAGQSNDLWICETCFLDNVAMTEFHRHFTQARHRIPPVATTAKFRCALSVGPLMVAWEAARIRNDYGVFGNAVKAITSSKFCSQSGIRGGPWYTLQGGCRGFQICQACYCGILAPCEMGSFFDLADSQANSDSMVRLCDLNPAAPRFLSYVEKLAQVIDVGDFSVFDRYVRRVVMVAPCPRRSKSNRGLWCCLDGCTVCPDCFETVAANTPFAHRFVIQRVTEQPPILCSLSSSRMRRKWAEACRDGTIEEFLSIARFRQDIYRQATSAIQHIKQLHGRRFGQALADVMLEYRVAAENGYMLAAREDHAVKGSNRPDSRLAVGTPSVTLQKLMQETLADTRRRDEECLIEEIENAWKTID